MGKVLFNLTWPEGTPSEEAICKRYGFEPGDLDPEFGVIEIDPQDHLFCILVDDEAAGRVTAEGVKSEGLEGPFSNPKIGPFGPPESE